MQLFGWTLHSCWMLLTVISVCCCVDIGSSAEINEEVMEEQPWIWNDMKLAGALRKFNSILDVGVTEEDNDNIDDRTAAKQNPKFAAPVSNFREIHQKQKEIVRSTSQDKGDEDYIYDVEGRPVAIQQPDADRQQFYAKTSDMKRSQKVSAHRRPNQGSTVTSSSSSSLTGDDIQQSMPVINAKQVEPRVLPLLGFHTAVTKINRQKEALLKKILRQAARRQSMKRSPNCMRKCIAQGLLHPAQCHSLC